MFIRRHYRHGEVVWSSRNRMKKFHLIHFSNVAKRIFLNSVELEDYVYFDFIFFVGRKQSYSQPRGFYPVR